MQLSPPSEETQAEIIARLENRIERLEQEISFLKEKGLSSEEQDIVLDRRQKVRKPRKNLLPIFFGLFGLLVIWTTYLSIKVHYNQSEGGSQVDTQLNTEKEESLKKQTNNSSSPDSDKNTNDGKEPSLENNQETRSPFSLPPRVPDLK